jgi:hypothetical protein
MRAGDADCAGLSEQPVIEWGPDREHATAAPFSRLQYGYPSSGLTEQGGGAQASQAGADDDDRERGRWRLGEEERGCARGERLPQEFAAAHGIRNLEFGIWNAAHEFLIPNS